MINHLDCNLAVFWLPEEAGGGGVERASMKLERQKIWLAGR